MLKEHRGKEKDTSFFPFVKRVQLNSYSKAVILGCVYYKYTLLSIFREGEREGGRERERDLERGAK